MNQKQTQTSWASAGKFDPINSTFKHIITMEGEPNNRVIPGYSKARDGVESPDKSILLEKQIIRFINLGYLFGRHHKYNTKTVSIEYFLNGKKFGTNDEPIFTLYPEDYVFHDITNELFTDYRLTAFLKRLYQEKQKGNGTPLPHKQKLYNYDKLFDIDKLVFKTEMQLHDYVIKKIQEGHPSGQCLDFCEKYRKKHFFRA